MEESKSSHIKMRTIKSDEEFDVKIIKKIGSGTYSDVFLAENITAGLLLPQKIAVKRYRIIVNKSKKNQDIDVLQNELIKKAKDEIETLKTMLNFGKVCQILGTSQNDTHPYVFSIALEYCEMTLKDLWLKNKKKLPIKEISQILNDLAGTLAKFQSMGIIHSDLKPSNILITEQNNTKSCKLIDFNCAINLNEFAKISISENSEEIKLPIRGTPLYMSPEYIGKIIEFEKNENMLKYSEKEYMNESEATDETKEMGTTFSILGHKKVFNFLAKKKVIFGDSGSCKNDVFSLGLIILRLSGIEIKRLNIEPAKLTKAIINFNKLVKKSDKNYHYLTKIIDKILLWNCEKRIDFLNLKADLIANNQMIESQFEPPQSNFVDYVNMETFSQIWNMSRLDEMNNHLFESVGYKCFGITQEYYDLIIRSKKLSEHSFENFKVDIKKCFNFLSQSEKQVFLKIFENNDNNFKNLLYIYSQETPLVYTMNKALALNKFKEYENFILALLQSKMEVNYQFPAISDKTKIYRGIAFTDESEKNNFKKHMNQYIVGLFYHWPAFTSCTKKKNIGQRFAISPGGVGVLFEIELAAKNRENKIDLEEFSSIKEEMEILLFPYFKFEVLGKSCEKLNGQTYTKISLKEIEGLNLNYKIIWYDPIVNNEENKEYQKMIRENNTKVELIVFDDMTKAIEFINKMENPAFVMTCGSKGEEFFGYVHEKNVVVKLFIFTSAASKKYHEDWSKKFEFHNKLVGVFDDIDEILDHMPHQNIIY